MGKKNGEPKRQRPTPAPASPRPSPWVIIAAQAFDVLGKIVDRFGVPFTLLVLIFGAVWVFGNTATHNDFIRELLFQSVTNRPYLSLFFVGIIAINLVGAGFNWVTARMNQSAELKRVSAEKSKWQEAALNADLHHTDEMRTRVEGNGSSVPPEGMQQSTPDPTEAAEADDVKAEKKKERER